MTNVTSTNNLLAYLKQLQETKILLREVHRYIVVIIATACKAQSTYSLHELSRGSGGLSPTPQEIFKMKFNFGGNFFIENETLGSCMSLQNLVYHIAKL